MDNSGEMPSSWDNSYFYSVSQQIPQTSNQIPMELQYDQNFLINVLNVESKYDKGFIANLFQLGYFPQTTNSLLALTVFIFFFAFAIFNFISKRMTLDMKIIQYLLVFIFVLSILGPLNIYLPGLGTKTTLGVTKLIMFALLFFSFVHGILKKKFELFNSYLFIPMSLYFLWMLSSVYWAQNIDGALNDLFLNLTGFLGFYISFYFFNKKTFVSSGKFLAKVISICCLVTSSFSLIALISKNFAQRFMAMLYPVYNNLIFLNDSRRGRITPLADVEFYLPLIFLSYTAFTGKYKYLSLLSFIFTSIAVFLSNTRYRFLIYILAVIGFFIFNNKKKIREIRSWIISLLVISFAIYMFVAAFVLKVNIIGRFLLNDRVEDYGTLETRLTMAQKAFEVFLGNPIKGVGIGNYRYDVSLNYNFKGRAFDPFNKIVISTYTHPHNWFLSVLAENGIIGLGLLTIIIYIFFKEDIALYKKLKGDELTTFSSISLICWLYIIGNFSTNLHSNLSLMLVFWSFRGIIEKIYLEKVRQ